jgi:hypothetical protein
LVTVAEVTYENVAWVHKWKANETRHLAVAGAPETLCDRLIGDVRVDLLKYDLPTCSGCRDAFRAEIKWSKK